MVKPIAVGEESITIFSITSQDIIGIEILASHPYSQPPNRCSLHTHPFRLVIRPEVSSSGSEHPV